MYDLQAGDIGLIRYDKKLGPDAWRLAKISEVLPGHDGRVRTIRVQFRPRHIRDNGKPYKHKTPIQMDFCMQRFAVILTKQEQDCLEEHQLDNRSQDDPEDGPEHQSAMTLNYVSDMTEIYEDQGDM